MRDFLRRNRAKAFFFGLLAFGSGCLTAAKKTGDQLAEDALSPIAVPIEAHERATKALEGVNERARERQEELAR
jgi:hypothetical protein